MADIISKFRDKDAVLFAEVDKLKSGKTESFNTIYDLSKNYVYKIIWDIVKNQDAADDIMQDTYLQVYNKIGSLADTKAFYSWAGRIATNNCLNYIKKESKYVLAGTDEDGEAEEFVFERASDDQEGIIPESVIINREQQKIIGDILDNLSTEQKLCVQYYYYEDMSVKEIAAQMETSEGTIKSRLNYARKAIKSAVETFEKKQGTRLYSLGGIPLLYLIIRENVDIFYGGAATAAGVGVGTAVGVSAASTSAAVGGATATAGGASAAATTATAGGATATATSAATASASSGGAVAGAAAAGTAATGSTSTSTAGGMSLGAKIALAVAVPATAVAGTVVALNIDTDKDKMARDIQRAEALQVAVYKTMANEEYYDRLDGSGAAGDEIEADTILEVYPNEPLYHGLEEGEEPPTGLDRSQSSGGCIYCVYSSDDGGSNYTMNTSPVDCLDDIETNWFGEMSNEDIDRDLEYTGNGSDCYYVLVLDPFSLPDEFDPREVNNVYIAIGNVGTTPHLELGEDGVIHVVDAYEITPDICPEYEEAK